MKDDEMANELVEAVARALKKHLSDEAEKTMEDYKEQPDGTVRIEFFALNMNDVARAALAAIEAEGFVVVSKIQGTPTHTFENCVLYDNAYRVDDNEVEGEDATLSDAAMIRAGAASPEMIAAGIEAWGEWLDSDEWRREVLVAEMFRRMMAVATVRPLKTLSPEELEPTVGAVLRVVDPIPPSPATVSYRWRR